MGRLAWNTAGSRYYEAGVDRGVLYIDELAGVPWVGLIAVEENPAGAEAKPRYIDGQKYLNIATIDEFEAAIRAYTYPVEFSQCDGTARIRDGLLFGQQQRKSFGFSYRTMVGNDVDGTSHGYKIHIVYDALATPSSRSAVSYNASVEASEFSWSVTTKQKTISGYSPTSHVVVDSRYTHPLKLAEIEDILYGTELNVARIPTPDELIDIFDTPLEWTVTDIGGGRFRVGGPDENVYDIGSDRFVLDHPSITIIDEDSFTITY